MSEIEKKVDRTNELLERLVSIQEDVQSRQKKMLQIYKRVLWASVFIMLAYMAFINYIY